MSFFSSIQFSIFDSINKYSQKILFQFYKKYFLFIKINSQPYLFINFNVKKNLKPREIQGEICCARCGAPEELINHVFFECLPARQVWVLSKIPSNSTIFPTSSLFTYMDHLFREFSRKCMIINLHGYYGTFRKEGTNFFLVVWILIPEKCSTQWNHNQNFGLRHMC